MANASTPSLPSTWPPSPSGTFFPHILIDHILPTLKGSEWPLLTVIIRQTMGWHDKVTGARKTQDWLTHGQLTARTGKGSEAVCAAIDGLVQKGLIEVRDGSGQLLMTPAARRRCRSRLYYGLTSTLQMHFQRKPKGSKPASSLPTFSVSRNGAAETTKEINTNTGRFGFSETTCTSLPGTLTDKSDAQGNVETVNVDTTRIIEQYQQLFQDQCPNGPVPSVTPDAIEQVGALLRRHPYEEVYRMLKPFFSSTFVYIQERGYSLSAFVTSYHLLQATSSKTRRRL